MFVSLVHRILRKNQLKPIKNLTKNEISTARANKLNPIIQSQYEDKVEGIISNDRFIQLSANYEREQEPLKAKISQIKKQLTDSSNQNNGIETFINYCKKHTDIKELDCEIVRVFINKTLVYAPEIIDGHRTQRIKVIYNFIG